MLSPHYEHLRFNPTPVSKILVRRCPLFLTRGTENGLFDRYTQGFETLWQSVGAG
jgi:hypothetical protein